MNREIKFPKLPENLDKRKKLMANDIAEIESLFSQGFSKTYIAKKFRVSLALIIYHLGGEGYKRKWNQKIIKRHAEKMKDDDYRLHHNETDSEYKKRKRVLQPEFNKYIIQQNKKWYTKSPENRKKWIKNAKEWREKNPDKLKDYQEKYKIRRKELYKLKKTNKG